MLVIKSVRESEGRGCGVSFVNSSARGRFFHTPIDAYAAREIAQSVYFASIAASCWANRSKVYFSKLCLTLAQRMHLTASTKQMTLCYPGEWRFLFSGTIRDLSSTAAAVWQHFGLYQPRLTFTAGREPAWTSHPKQALFICLLCLLVRIGMRNLVYA
jgi:hypothetical protein